MKVFALLVLMLMNVPLCRSCRVAETFLFCSEIPPASRPGYSTLVMAVQDVGEINATVFHSNNLSSITSLSIEDAGVTGIAEGAFGSLQNLTSLSLNQNLLVEVNPRWLARPHFLRELDVTENQIQVVSESMLNGLNGLTQLRLSHNRIRTIHPNSFLSLTNLSVLDLSENRMTRLSPQVFGSLTTTRIRLDGNPWDCSCGAEEFVELLKDLQSRSLLDRQLEVTCESPPSLRGQPAWNVSVCDSSAQTRPPIVTQTVQPKPTDDLSAIPTATSAYVTSPPAVTEISVLPKPSELPTTLSRPTEACVTSWPSSDANIVLMLVAVIVVLSLLLVAACFLAVLRKRKRNSKAVTPGHPEGNRDEVKEDGRSSRSRSPGGSESREDDPWDSETGWRRSFTGVRAKSAHAILSLSPLCEHVTLQTQARSKDAENQDEEKQNPGDESRVDGGVETKQPNTGADVKPADDKPAHDKQADVKPAHDEQADDKPAHDKQADDKPAHDKQADDKPAHDKQADDKPAHDKQADPGGNLVSVNNDIAPYLSIGTNQKKHPGPDGVDGMEQSAGGPGQRSHRGKVMGRISTWPPTAVQWQARCKVDEDKRETGVFTVWTPMFPAEVENVSRFDKEDDGIEKHQDLRTAPLNVAEAHMELGDTRSSEPDDQTSSFSSDSRPEEQPQAVQDPVWRTPHLDQQKPGPSPDLKSAEDSAHKNPSSKAEERSERQRAATSRRRAGNRSTGPKAPSGGGSPDDDTLPSGAFMDLLHEVVQNNGRWTRDRWKQVQANKQRGHAEAAKTVREEI